MAAACSWSCSPARRSWGQVGWWRRYSACQVAALAASPTSPRASACPVAGAETDAAVAACRRSDACIFFVGTTAVWGGVQEVSRFGTLPLLSPAVEGEGWDRTDLGLPGRQLSLIQVGPVGAGLRKPSGHGARRAWRHGTAARWHPPVPRTTPPIIPAAALRICAPCLPSRRWPSAAAPPSLWCWCMAARWMWSGSSAAPGWLPSSRPGCLGRRAHVHVLVHVLVMPCVPQHVTHHSLHAPPPRPCRAAKPWQTCCLVTCRQQGACPSPSTSKTTPLSPTLLR